jgi:type I restriction enzyme S subunit
MCERWDLTYFRRPAFNHKSADFPNVHLSEVIHPLSETTRRLNPSEFPTSDFSYIGMENVESGSGRLVGNTDRQGAEIKSSCIMFRREHILYGKLRPYLRKVVDCSELDFDQGIASSEFLSLRPQETASQAWLTHYLRSSAVAEQAKVAIGARMPRISTDALLNVWVPLPPLPVQRQIMERVAAGREEITREREAAERLTRDISAEIEALILGTKKLTDL